MQHRTTRLAFGACLGACLALPVAAQSQLWIRQFGSTNFDWSHALAPDSAGGAFIAGSTTGSLGGPFAGSYDAWLARYDNAGNQLWIRQLGTSKADRAYALAPDSAGGAFVAGDTYGGLGGPISYSQDAWVARYDSAGNKLWICQLNINAGDEATALAPDDAGGTLVAGNTYGGSIAGWSLWLARYDNAGSQLWIRQFGSRAHDYATALAPDGNGGAFVAGYTNGSLGAPNAGFDDAWIARYDSAGNRLWIRQFGTNSRDVLTSIAPDGAGGAFVAGWTSGSLGGPWAGLADPWMARYNGEGDRIWIHQFGTSSTDEAWALATDSAGGAFIAGRTFGSLGGPSSFDDDVWLARYADACYPDCNNSGILDVLDFFCFTNAFNTNDPYADCDGSGTLDLFDFLCFVNAFNAGCP